MVEIKNSKKQHFKRFLDGCRIITPKQYGKLNIRSINKLYNSQKYMHENVYDTINTWPNR